MKTKIYISNVDCLEDKALFDEYYNCVNASRQKKIDKIRFESDKRLSLGVELLLKKALIDNGIDYENAGIVFGENGKPYIKDNEIFYNLSHSGSFVCCAVSDSEIGIDAENIKRANLKISEKIFTKSEINRLEEAKNKEKEFIRLWALKESYMKYSGSGLSVAPKEIEIEFAGAVPKYKSVSFFEFEKDGYMISCCFEKNCSDIEIEAVDLSV